MQLDDLRVADIYGSDPIAKVLMGRWRVRPFTLALFFLIGGAIYLTLLPALFGYALPSDNIVRASLEDTFNQVSFLLIFPAIVYYYARQPQRITDVYEAVAKSVHPVGGETIFSGSRIRALYARHWWMPGMLFGGLGIVLGIYDNIGKFEDYWYAANWLMISILQCARGIGLYMLMTTIARHLVACVGLNEIHARTEFSLRVGSVDQNAGYQAITNYWLFSSTLAGASENGRN